MIGWIALDMDGTITLDKYSVPESVVLCLRQCVRDGWRIVITTGRSTSGALLALSQFDFPYFLLAQNGTVAFEMPAKKVLFKRYISKHSLRQAELAFQGIAGDFITYSGYDQRDRVYVRLKRFDDEQMEYLTNYLEKYKEEIIPISSLEEIQQDSIPLVKCFGRVVEMKHLTEQLRATKIFNVTMIRDPHAEGYYLLLVTDRNASKGQSLEALIEQQGKGRGCVIAAGDDANDESLLEVADIAIAMAHAPDHLQAMADIIAPPTSEFGIVTALEIAIRDQKNV